MSHTIFAHHQKRLRGLSHRLSKIESHLKITEKKLNQAFTWRLLLGLLTAITGLAVGTDIRYRDWGISFLFFLGSFFYFVRYSHQLKKWQQRLQGWHSHCLRLSQRLNGKMPAQNPSMDLHVLPPEETILAKDLHILGETSLFHLIDETFSSGGRKILLSMLLSPLKSLEVIRQRQDHLKMLAKKWWPLTRFVLLGQNGQLPPDSLRLQNELNRSFTGSHFSLYLVLHLIFFPLTLLLAGLWLAGTSPLSGILLC